MFETNLKWHVVSEGDLPEVSGEYLAIVRTLTDLTRKLKILSITTLSYSTEYELFNCRDGQGNDYAFEIVAWADTSELAAVIAFVEALEK